MCSLLTVHRISLSAVRSSRSCTRNLAQLEKVKCTSLKNFKGFIFTQSLMNTTTTNDTSVHVNGMSSKLSLDAARALEVYNKTLGRKSLSPDGIYILHTDVAGIMNTISLNIRIIIK